MAQHNLTKAKIKTNQSRNSAHRKAVLAIACILFVIIVGTSMENLISNKAFAYADSINGLGVGIYWDHACTNRTLSLDWGQLEAGSNSTLTVYIRNEGNSAIYLWMNTSNWTPSAASSYMNLTWNYSNQTIGVNQVIPLELTLSVAQNISGITHFNFDTTITSAS